MRELEVKLDRGLRLKVERALSETVLESVRASENRDAWLTYYAEVVEEAVPEMEQVASREDAISFQDASRLNDPITQEQFLSLLSAVVGGIRKPPFWLVQEVDPADRQAAMTVEWWLTAKCFQFDYPKRLYDLSYNALRDPCAILYCGWGQKVEDERVVQYRGPDGIYYYPEERQPGVSYEEVEFLIEGSVLDEGPEFRVIDLADFYLWPHNAQSVKGANGCGERLYVTAWELYEGIKKYGYDEETVMELLRRGPTHIEDDYGRLRTLRDERDGVGSNNSDNPGKVSADQGYYELYTGYTKMPMLLSGAGKVETPQHMIGQDFCLVLCPQHDKLLKLAYSSYRTRPYFPHHIYPIPNRLYGHCLPKMLLTLQEEATANGRFVLDMFNFTANPVLIAPQERYKEVGKFSIYPGAVIPEQRPGELRPLVMDKSGLPIGFELQQFFGARARDFVSGQGYGQMPQKVRKEAEVELAAQGVGAKFSLFLENLVGDSESVAAHLIEMYAERLPAEGESVTVKSGATPFTQDITPETLKRRYRFIPRANTEVNSPEARVEKTRVLLNEWRTSPIYAMKMQMGDMTGERYLLSKLLEEAGERDVDAIIGTGEELAQQQMMLQQQMMMQQAAMMGGNPAAQAAGGGSGGPQPPAAPPGQDAGLNGMVNGVPLGLPGGEMVGANGSH